MSLQIKPPAAILFAVKQPSGSFLQSLRAECTWSTKDDISFLQATTANRNWPAIFGSSHHISCMSLLIVRCCFAAIFLATLLADLITDSLRRPFYFYFIYLTTLSFILQTVYFCFAVHVTFHARAVLAAGDHALVGDRPESLPWSVRSMALLWALCVPLSICICFTFWFLVDPFWNLDPDMPIDYFMLFQHGGNTVLFLVEFCISRNPWHLRYAIPFVAYAISYAIWTSIHFSLKIGVPSDKPCEAYELNDCPIYSVFDWHHPLRTVIVFAMLCVAGILIIACLWCAKRSLDKTAHGRRSIRRCELPQVS